MKFHNSLYRSITFSLSFLFIILFTAGCAVFRPHRFHPAVTRDGVLEITSVQHAYSLAPRMGYNTVEIYLENRGRKSVRLSSVELDGVPLPSHDLYALSEDLFKLDMGHEEIPIMKTRLPLDGEVTWWQFYPSDVVPSGGSVVCQVNLRDLTTFQRKIRIIDSNGNGLETDVPRFRQPEELITAITWNLDYSRVYVQYKSASPPERVWFNNIEITDFNHMRAFKKDVSHHDTLPNVVAFKPPFYVKTGLPVYAKIEFAGGRKRCAMIRALNDITLDVHMPYNTTKSMLAEFNLGCVKSVYLLPLDVLCADARAGENGWYAMSTVIARAKYYKEHPDTLSGVSYCTAMYSSLWNIYGQTTDFVYAKPYRLHWGSSQKRFIEEEEFYVMKARDTSAPRPFFWLPERFRRERNLEGEEFRVMSWMMLVQGAKGIRYNFWMNDPENPFRDCPDLGMAIKNENALILKKREYLSPLLFVKEWSDDSQKIKIYKAWCGEKGLLVMARNLDYETDAKDNAHGSKPRFHAARRENVQIKVELPEWFTFSEVANFLSGEKIKATLAKDGKNVTCLIPEFDSMVLIWLKNGA